MECYLICFYSILKIVINRLIQIYFIVMKNLLHAFGKDHLDEVVFANRNKAYGAYALRNEYSSQLTKALFVGVTFFASLSIVPLIVSSFETRLPVTKEYTEHEFVPINEPIDTPKPTPTSTVPQKVKTVESTNYTPVRVVKNDKPVPTEEDKKNAAVSSVTSPGVETTLPVAPPIQTGPPATHYTPAAPPVAPVEDPDKIRTGSEVDVAADFKGGINAFRQKVSQNFDTESVDHSGMVSGIITFVVERDGSITNIKVTGQNADFNKEAERTVKSIKTKWTPAQLNGKTVRSSFRMPISMRIE
ncbi:protein TonB [Epilithonimonas arachidiradicis]|uniref:Protein TonB n=2 Tax=Epilithonimonas arachidiradicis TaxID=1617282 RepID=A0A420DB58_9FLAO|nr:protein TonB [Epilithonimonas arachidiradicis]